MTSDESYEGLPEDLDAEDMRLLELEAAAYLSETIFKARPLPQRIPQPRPLLLEARPPLMPPEILAVMCAGIFGAGLGAGYCMTRLIDLLRGRFNA